jgi:hypothetical protein
MFTLKQPSILAFWRCNELVKLAMALLSAVAFYSSVPLVSALSSFNSTTRSDIAPTWVSNPDTRSTSDILYSCIITISLCVYTALHLNVPPQGTTKISGVIAKAKWVVVGVFAPEIVVYTAFLQMRCVFKFWKAMKVICLKSVEASRISPDPEKGLIEEVTSTPELVHKLVHRVDGAGLEHISDTRLANEQTIILENKPVSEEDRNGTIISAISTSSSTNNIETSDHSVKEAGAGEAEDKIIILNSLIQETELNEFRIRREEIVSLLVSAVFNYHCEASHL